MQFQLPKWLKNKYAITLIAFVIWMLFFDPNDFFSQVELRSELTKLEQNKVYYQKEIEATNKSLQELLSNDEKLEKFAREKYYMKKENEEIFVFVEE